MIKSMTGYGRQEEILGTRHIQVEIKSVNHRYFEFTTRVSRGYSFLEEKMKTYIRNFVARGKVDLFISVESTEGADVEISVNRNVAAGYISAMRELCSDYELEDDITASTLARFSDIFTVSRKPEDENAVWNDVKTVADQAIASFLHMRIVEGQKLKEDVSARAEKILSLVKEVEQRSPETVEAYRRRLYARLQEVLQDKAIDEQRVVTEAALFADKIAVDEETVRLRSHLAQFQKLLESAEPVGRKLDFLVQEMNREANTIGSKCSDTQIAYAVVDIKAEIEKIREQIQNIE
ncbi:MULTISPECIES: YicC/YloC family endoribonuclease [Caproicibacterium]|uniref:YicC/YloC family endoribonuclease n=1 Tax=Caproicibacterium argilliputei TaxID=3030016 RepID=A0AA97D8K5_9FIRM|nr:YicC/YloC family endoribonuclease [Caproicibacterium argilliputei]WOC31045.1 YicC/YloC family endoribonuclease [Caproicibacterium argilliputei]